MVIDAPDFGQVVKIQPYRYKGSDYAGGYAPGWFRCVVASAQE
jgi:hypothetical protein